MAKTSIAAATNGDATSTSVQTKQQKSFATYISNVEGKEVESNFPVSSATAVRTTFANGAVRDLAIADLPGEMANCAILQGLAVRLQRSYQAEKDIDKCVEAADETIADLKNGIWIEPRTGAPRVTILAQAIERTLIAKGEEVSEARLKSIVEKLKNANFVEKAMANKAVVAAVDEIKFENMKRRRDESKKAAKEDNSSLDLGV